MSTFKDEIRGWPQRYRDAFEERAGIIENEGRELRAKAEFLAYRDTKKQMEADNANRR